MVDENGMPMPNLNICTGNGLREGQNPSRGDAMDLNVNFPNSFEYQDINLLAEDDSEEYQQYWNRANFNLLRNDAGFFRNYGNRLESDYRFDILFEDARDYESSSDDD